MKFLNFKKTPPPAPCGATFFKAGENGRVIKRPALLGECTCTRCLNQIEMNAAIDAHNSKPDPLLNFVFATISVFIIAVFALGIYLIFTR